MAGGQKSGLQIFHCEQGSDEWFDLRKGIPTASEFSAVLSKDSKVRDTYMRKLAAERIIGAPTESYTNPNMQRGKDMEPRALADYAYVTGTTPERIGFARNFNAGCSPDALVGKTRVVEIKTIWPHLLIAHIQRDEFPNEHMAQCQGALWILEREEIDISLYWPAMPAFIKSMRRDEGYIRQLADAVARFNYELDVLEDKIRRYGMPLPSARRRKRK